MPINQGGKSYSEPALAGLYQGTVSPSLATLSVEQTIIDLPGIKGRLVSLSFQNGTVNVGGQGGVRVYLGGVDITLLASFPGQGVSSGDLVAAANLLKAFPLGIPFKNGLKITYQATANNAFNSVSVSYVVAKVDDL